jgi:hypothetical protein
MRKWYTMKEKKPLDNYDIWVYTEKHEFIHAWKDIDDSTRIMFCEENGCPGGVETIDDQSKNDGWFSHRRVLLWRYTGDPYSKEPICPKEQTNLPSMDLFFAIKKKKGVRL